MGEVMKTASARPEKNGQPGTCDPNDWSRSEFAEIAVN